MKHPTIAVFAVSVLLLAGCCTTRQTKRWEYKTLTSYQNMDEVELNNLGKDGWILVGFAFVPAGTDSAQREDEYRYVLKRPTN